MLEARYDAVVLGGGPAGLSAALALRRGSSATVLVADAGRAERERVGESTPAEILVPLAKLGLLERFWRGEHVPCPGSASVWGGEGVGYKDFILSPMGPAWRLHRRSFEHMLAEAAEQDGVQLLQRTRFVRTLPAGSQAGQGHDLLLALPDQDEAWVHAEWVIDATGPAASFARALGVHRQIDDRMVGLAWFSPLHGEAMTFQTLLEATADGWWYVARLPAKRVITMFVTDGDTLRRFRADGDTAWQGVLAATSLVGPALARHSLMSPMQEARTARNHQVLPICSSYLEQAAGARWIAVGDAAASYDPVVGQGLYQALYSGVAAGQHVRERLRGGARPQAREPAPYLDRMRASFVDYCQNRAYLYGLEKRWPNSPFWRCRVERAQQALQRCGHPQSIR